MPDRHSTIAHAAYHDLLRALQEERISELRGTPTKITRNGRIYWYDSFRIGSDVRKRYIGEDSDSLRALFQRHAELKADTDARRAQRTRLVRILRAEGFLRLDGSSSSLLAALATSGVFRLGGTVVGTMAFRLYEGELGIRLSFDQMAQTDDMDIASFERLSLALEDVAAPPLDKVLADFAFAPAPSLDGHKTWRWKQTRGNSLVEFLTPSFSDDEGLRALPALGVEAQSLHHLNYLLAEPIHAALPYRSGVLVQIPRPERFAIHKLIVAERRRGGPAALKALKDRQQAAFLIEVLAQDRPDELAEAYALALQTGPKWRARIEASLRHLPQTDSLLRNL